MIMNYGIGIQLPVDSTHYMTILRDDTIVVMMTNESVVFFDSALQCQRVVDVCVDKYQGYAIYNLGTSSEWKTAHVIVWNGVSCNTLLLPDRSIQSYGCIQTQIKSIAIQNGNIAVLCQASDMIKMFQAYIDIHIPTVILK